MPGYLNSQSVFASPVSAFAATTAGGYDLWGLLTGASDKVALHETRLGVSSTAITAFSILLLRGSTASSTSGSALVANLKGQTGAVTDPSSVTPPCTALVSTASASLIYADAFPVANNQGYVLRPSGIDQTPWIIIDAGQRAHVRITAPSVAATISGTLVYEILSKSGMF